MTDKREEYDWLNDPFDEKKCAEEYERARSGKHTGCAFAAVAVIVVVMAVVAVALLGALSVLGTDLGA